VYELIGIEKYMAFDHSQ